MVSTDCCQIRVVRVYPSSGGARSSPAASRAAPPAGEVLALSDYSTIEPLRASFALTTPSTCPPFSPLSAGCWPALLVSLVSGTVSAAARTLGHWISFGLTLGLMALVWGFTFYSRRNRLSYKPWWRREGPIILITIAVPLIMADILRHVLQDTGLWPSCIVLPGGGCAWYSSAEYKSGEAETTQDENLTHLSTIGILFTVVCTYSGFVLLAVGTLWNANIVQKWGVIKAKWARLRGQMQARSSGKTLSVQDDLAAEA